VAPAASSHAIGIPIGAIRVGVSLASSLSSNARVLGPGIVLVTILGASGPSQVNSF